MNEANATNIGKNKIQAFEWYVPYYTLSIPQQAIISKQFSSQASTELQYVERIVFMKELKTQNFWNFELGTQERMNNPVWIIIAFQQKERQDSQNINNDNFYRSPLISTQCFNSTEKYPDSKILLNYDDHDCSQEYEQIKEAFKALIKDDILQTYISDNDSRSSINGNVIG